MVDPEIWKNGQFSSGIGLIVVAKEWGVFERKDEEDVDENARGRVMFERIDSELASKFWMCWPSGTLVANSGASPIVNLSSPQSQGMMTTWVCRSIEPSA